MSSERRYTVTRIDGYADAAPKASGGDVPPGATFHVIDGLTGRMVAAYRSEDVASGLPHPVRITVAASRADDAADRLERESSELLPA